MSSSHRTLGQKIMHFLFHSPTESDLGLPPPKEHLTKSQAMEKIEYAWDHPLHPQKKEKSPKESEHHEHHEHSHKTMGQKISHLLFDVPHDSDLGVPPPKKQMSKEEALKLIEYAWDHPMHPQKDEHPKKAKNVEHEKHHHEDSHEDSHETLGQRVSHYLFDAPHDSDLGLPPPKQQLSKEEALKAIDHAWEHPFNPKAVAQH